MTTPNAPTIPGEFIEREIDTLNLRIAAESAMLVKLSISKTAHADLRSTLVKKRNDLKKKLMSL